MDSITDKIIRYLNDNNVVEVVRCKDCKHLSDYKIAPEWKRICRLQGVGKSDDGFFDEGKRKEVKDGD